MAKLVYTDQSGREITETLGPDSPVVTVGRAKDCTIRSNRKSVSRRHAEFHYNDGRCEVIDLDSSNGTFLIVDDRRQPVKQPKVLSDRDEVWCGDFILYFIQEEEEVRDHQQQAGSGGVQGNFDQRPDTGRQAPMTGGGSGDTPPPQPGGVSGGVAAGGGDDASGPQQQPGGVGGGVSVGTGQDAPAPPSAGLGAEVSSVEAGSPPPPSGGVGGGVSQVDDASTGPTGGLGSSDSMAHQNNHQNDPGPPTSVDQDVPSNAELQRLRDEKESIQQLADRQTNKVDELTGQLNEARTEVDEANEELQRLRRELEEARNTGVDKGEIERLQQEIKNRDRDLEILEKELERESEEAERLRAELAEQEQRIASVESERDELENELERTRQQDDPTTEIDRSEILGDQNGVVDEAARDELAEHARTLDRIVDAIERTDLSPLSTVDRVRLESAIRETEPRKTLSAMLEIIGAELE